MRIQNESLEIEDVSSRIEENVKSEKPGDELEILVPSEQNPITSTQKTKPIPNKEKPKFSLKRLLNKSNAKIVTSIKISKAVEAESPNPNIQNPKISLNGLLSKSNVKIVTSIKVFKCGICNQEWVQDLVY